jgi:predicted nucleotidyltransferase
MKKSEKTPFSHIQKAMVDLSTYLNDNVTSLNNSKLFAGLMIITLNIASKFVTIKLSKTMESYLKYTFSRDILVFAIAWMGTRDIYVALTITVLFVVATDYIFNEDSMLCCLPENFTDYHVSLLESKDKVSEEDIKKAQEVLERAKKQKEAQDANTVPEKPNTDSDPHKRPMQYQNFGSF